MKGNNEIHINQATMIEAIQLWLDHQFKTAPEAMYVSKNNNPTSFGGSEQFIIRVKQHDAAPSEHGEGGE